MNKEEEGTDKFFISEELLGGIEKDKKPRGQGYTNDAQLIDKDSWEVPPDPDVEG